MPDYSKSKIYKLKSSLTDDVFIATTTTTIYISKCLAAHISNYKKSSKKTGPVAKLGLAELSVELIENYPCKSKPELNQRVSDLIKETSNCINISAKVQPMGEAEHKRLYRERNKAKAQEYNKSYYLKNKEKYFELNKKWRAANREKVKEQHSKYSHSEKGKKKAHDYYLQRKNKASNISDL